MSWTMTAEEREAFLADLHVGVLSVAAGEAQPPVTAPVWYTYDPGGLVSIITARESVKARHSSQRWQRSASSAATIGEHLCLSQPPLQ